MKTTAQTPGRNAFTLVEMLLVVGIIAILMALLTPAVMRARAAARNAAIKAEIDMLHMAIMNYKNEYGSFPPCQSADPNLGPAVKHLMRLFPRIVLLPGLPKNRWDLSEKPGGPARDQLDLAAQGFLKAPPDSPSGTKCYEDLSNRNNIVFGPETAIVFWLEGYTANPASPMYPASDRKKLFDFDESRRVSTGIPQRFTGLYHVSGKPESWYVYFDAANYQRLPYPVNEAGLRHRFVHVQPDRVLTNGNVRQIPTWVSALSSQDQELWFFTLSEDPAERPHQRPFNPDTFQILCAGMDGIWGTDDDVSNFWKGTRREYLDSLKN
jgi:prepilin-type N-terminal cleavage/methylation domain-containing protein